MSSVLGICLRDDFALCDCQLLCASCGDGEGQAVPVYAEVVGRATFSEQNTYIKKHILPPRWRRGAGCLLGHPGCLLGASWVRPGCPGAQI